MASSKYCLIMVFDYQGTLSKTGTPRGLLGMAKDIKNAFNAAHVLCGIPKKNITIITDVNPSSPKSPCPWEVESPDKDNPNVIRLMYPSISVVLESMLKFINKIWMIEHDKKRKVELFSYFSGHGVTLNDPSNPRGKKTSCIILINSSGKERRYLTKKELINIYHNRIEPDNLGMVTIPIIKRKLLPKTNNNEYIYTSSTVNVDSGATGVPRVDIEMFFLYDACQAGSLSGLRYKYISDNVFESTYDEDIKIPMSMAISVTNDTQEAPSCTDGSPFTAQMCELIRKTKEEKDVLTVKRLQNNIRQNLHPLLVKRCTPTISMSVASLTVTAPIISCNPTT